MNIKRQLSLIKQMLYLLATVRNGKISRTAEENGIKTSNLSNILKELETDSGIILLNRKSDGIEPTAAGKKLYKLAKEFEETVNKLQKIQAKTRSKNKVYFFKPENMDVNLSGYKKNNEIYSSDSFSACDVAVLTQKPHELPEQCVETKAVIESNKILLNYWIICKNPGNKSAYHFYRFLVVSMM